MPDDLARYETHEKVGIVTMNRPEKLNALNPALREAVAARLHEADRDPSTSVVVLRSEGRSFCVGYDIGGGGGDPEGDKRHDALAWHALLSEALDFEMIPFAMRKPVIASVQGHALGGGCELAMFCDLTLAAEDALFGEPEVRFSDTGPGIVMPWMIGVKRARELLFFGDMIDAQTALAFGMVNRLFPAAELREATLKYAKRLALVAPEALMATKLAINRGLDAAGFRTAMKAGLDVLAPLYAARTEVGMQFHEITLKQGLGAALKWRRAQFDALK